MLSLESRYGFVLSQGARAIIAIGIIYFVTGFGPFAVGQPDTSPVEGIWQVLSDPLLMTGKLIGAVLLVCIIAAYGLIRQQRRYMERGPDIWSNTAAAARSFLGAIPDVIATLLLLAAIVSLPHWSPSLLILLTDHTELVLIPVGLVYTLLRLAAVNRELRETPLPPASHLADLRLAAATVLQSQPIWIISAIFVFEGIWEVFGAGHTFLQGLINMDTTLFRYIAVAAMLFVVGCHLAGGLLRAAGSEPPAQKPSAQNPEHAATGFLWAGGALCLFWLFAAIFPFLFSAYGPGDNDFSVLLRPPSAEHWFGTDRYGRDIFTRTIHGAQPVLLMTAAITLCATGITALLSFLPRPGRILVGILASSFTAIPILIFVFFPLPRTVYIWPLPLFGYLSIYIAALMIQSIDTMAERLGPANGRNWLAWAYAVASAALRHAALILPLLITVNYFQYGVDEPNAAWGMTLQHAKDFEDMIGFLVLLPGSAMVSIILGFSMLAAWCERRAIAPQKPASPAKPAAPLTMEQAAVAWSERFASPPKQDRL